MGPEPYVTEIFRRRRLRRAIYAASRVIDSKCICGERMPQRILISLDPVLWVGKCCFDPSYMKAFTRWRTLRCL